jgi:putative ABC transport system ATP-binding protein
LCLFEELHRDGSTIIVVTHAAEVAERAGRRITLHDGRVIKDGPARPYRCPEPLLWGGTRDLS